MQNIGNSLAFWKKSPPKDQFATNPKPSESFSPSGLSSQSNTSVANNRPSNYPFGNTGTGNTSSGAFANQSNNTNMQNQQGFGQENRVASRSGFGSRSPYSNQMPGSNSSTSGASRFGSTGSNQFNSQPNNSLGNYNRGTGSNTGGFNNGFSTGGSAAQNSGSGLGANSNMSSQSQSGSFSTNQNPNTSTPSSQFRNSQSGFQPGSSTYVPNRSGTFGNSNPGLSNPGGSNTNGTNSGTTTSGQQNGQSTPSSNWENYPSTNYPGFGSTSSQSKLQTAESNSGFQAKNVQASANMSPPPSLPSSVFDKKGGYAPGSTGKGRASQAGFESSNSLYSPPSGSKIPSSSDGLYSPN